MPPLRCGPSRPRPEPTPGALDLPPRSRLYGLEPCGGATDWCECLTSYINRLGWAHGVAPRALVLQEIGPLLDAGRWDAAAPRAMRGFCAVSAMGLNGLGDRAADWATILERLTLSPDLQRLTAAAWLGAFPNPRLLRTGPAWCPACYQEWREQDRPIYQPMLWMFRVVTRCPRHDTPLRQRCPHCGAPQVVIVAHAGRAGACTRCARWLGVPPPPPSASTPHGEDVPWQRWVVRVLAELRGMHGTPGLRRWDTALAHLAAALKHPGSYARLASVSGIDRDVLHRWTAGSVAPSFELILQFCYTCNTTPRRLMLGQVGSLERTIHDALAANPIRHRRATHRRDRERCRGPGGP